MSELAGQNKLARLMHYLELDPDNAFLCFDLGDTYLKSGDLDQAAKYFGRAVELGHPVGRQRLADVKLRQRQFAEALECLQPLLDHEEVDVAVRVSAGIALVYLARYREAIDQLSLAREKMTAPLPTERYLTYAYHGAGDVAKAIKHCEAWAAGGGGNPARAYLGVLHFDAGDRVRARALVLETAAADPMEPEAQAVLGTLALEEQRFEDAQRAFDQALAVNPNHGRAWLGKGLGELHAQRFQPALDSLRGAAERMPNHPGTLITVGWACLLAGATVEAETWCRRALELDRNFAEAHGALAAVLACAGRHDEAKQSAAIADRLDPKNFGSVYAKAQMLSAQGRKASADELMRRALDTPPIPGAPPIFAPLKALLKRA